MKISTEKFEDVLEKCKILNCGGGMEPPCRFFEIGTPGPNIQQNVEKVGLSEILQLSTRSKDQIK